MPITGAKEVAVFEDGPNPPGFSAQVCWFTPDRAGGPRESVATASDLRRMVVPFEKHERLVIYLDRDGGYSGSLMAHITGDRAFVCHFTEPGDVGDYCCDPSYDGPDEMVGMMLSNGQLDHYHRYWTISRWEALRALEYFVAEGQLDPSVCWVREPQSLMDRPKTP